MACFHPLPAWRTGSGDIVFVERGDIRHALTLPCGQCIGCRLERSRKWAIRCIHESQTHEWNSFVTLTYRDEDCPVSLNYRHFQLFMKRLRKHFGPVRFFMCGEYGDLYSRPHFHACLFGIHFSDRVALSVGGSVSLYRSAILESIWPHGFSTIGDVTFESAAYVARYVMKKVTGPSADAHYERVSLSTGEIVNVTPEFCHMSLKPGIGARWFAKYKNEVYSDDQDGVRVNGFVSSAPRYYDFLLSKSDPELSEYLEKVRYDRRCNPEESSTERLAVREKVTKARVSQFRREL